MREIKFRAWDKELKLMSPVGRISLQYPTALISQPLLKTTSLFIQVLKKRAQKLVSTGTTSRPYYMGKEPKLEDTGDTSEIIGNIYENSELIK